MATRRPRKRSKSAAAARAGAVSIPPTKSIRLSLASPRAIQVKHLQVPPRFVKPKRIHARRVLPFVREGVERQFHSVSARAIVTPVRSLTGPALAAADDLVLLRNTELSQPGQQQTASNVGEPSVAVNGNVVFFTGNWYAAMSSDGGQSFQYLDPASVFAAVDPPNSHFCCDQVVNYIPSIDTFVWLLQYGPDTGDNIQRLAFAKTPDVVSGKWRLFDITTAILGVPGAFLDFPDLAVGANNLYVTTNIFFPDPNQAGSGVVRIPIAGIASGQIAAQRFVSTDFQSFRVAQNCGTTAYFAAHQDTSTLAVFSWDEGQAAPNQSQVGVARWIGGNGYQSRTPDGNRWLDRADPRLTGATLAGNELWFAWSVDARSNQRVRPFVQIARIDSRNLTLIENINVFDVDSATCYGALAPNGDNEVGISYMIGGGPREPSHVVGILTNNRKDVIVAQGDRGPLPDPQTGKGEWGDYLTVRPALPDPHRFAATGYTLKGAADGTNRDATPRFVVFGRGAAPSPSATAGPRPGTTTDTTPSVSQAGPIADVNALSLVGPADAAAIKRAAGIPLTPGPTAARAMEGAPEIKTKPGVERWPVKTGTDADVALVGKNVIGGKDLGPGIVSATVEELIAAPRPQDMSDPLRTYDAYQSKRAAPVETTIWQVEVTITAMKLEADGDYHLVLQGASGETMIGEIPTPTKTFVGNSPWLDDIGQSRRAIDDKFVSHLSPSAFVRVADKLVPREAVSTPQPLEEASAASFLPPLDGQMGSVQPFKTQLSPTRARITGVGFFDKVHGQMGVSQSNGIELHPVLKIEWI